MANTLTKITAQQQLSTTADKGWDPTKNQIFRILVEKTHMQKGLKSREKEKYNLQKPKLFVLLIDFIIIPTSATSSPSSSLNPRQGESIGVWTSSKQLVFHFFFRQPCSNHLKALPESPNCFLTLTLPMKSLPLFKTPSLVVFLKTFHTPLAFWLDKPVVITPNVFALNL